MVNFGDSDCRIRFGLLSGLLQDPYLLCCTGLPWLACSHRSLYFVLNFGDSDYRIRFSSLSGVLQHPDPLSFRMYLYRSILVSICKATRSEFAPVALHRGLLSGDPAATQISLHLRAWVAARAGQAARVGRAAGPVWAAGTPQLDDD